MFANAIKEVANYTRAIHSISRNFGNPKIHRGSASLFFVNQEGWALTCKHVAQWIGQADQVNKRFANFINESKNSTGNQQNKLAKKLGLTAEQLFEMRITFVDCVDQIKNLKFIIHPEYDLALLKFEGFNQSLFTGAPTFLADDQSIQSGDMLCRLGFPFPEFTNYKLDQMSQSLKWTKEGMARSPRFPIEGMVTRFLGGKKGEIHGIEMSTPGLRGQSGGPLFDSEGRIYGMQSRTKHLHLGFDIEEKEVIAHGKAKKINDYAFIHLGECVHVKVIKDFLRKHQVSFQEG